MHRVLSPSLLCVPSYSLRPAIQCVHMCDRIACFTCVCVSVCVSMHVKTTQKHEWKFGGFETDA